MTTLILRAQASVSEGSPCFASPDFVAGLPRSIEMGADRYAAVRDLSERLVAELSAILGSGAFELVVEPTYPDRQPSAAKPVRRCGPGPINR